jgi:hypothetical protein
MEVDLGEPSIVREIGTKTNIVTRTKIRTNPITKIIIKHLLVIGTKTRTNTTKVEEAISLVDPAPGHDYVA